MVLFYIKLATPNKQSQVRETAMTQYNEQMMIFKDIFGKKVEVDFYGGEVTSDAGLLFLRETESDLGIINRVADVLRDRRHPSYVKHEIVQLLTQRVFQIASGYEDANDSNDLRDDPIIKIACDKLPISDSSLASQPTMCRFENAYSRTDLYRIAQAFLDAFVDSYDKGPNTRFIVTDLKNTQRRFIYRTIYCGRGEMELMIKEHKNHLASDRTSCSSFEANQFRLFLHSIAYVLLHTFRRLHLKNTEFANAQFNTIRLKLLKIGGRVRQLKTKVKINLPSSFPLKEDLLKIWVSCSSAGYT